MSDFDEKEQVACKVCGGAMEAAALESSGWSTDSWICSSIAFADFMEVE